MNCPNCGRLFEKNKDGMFLRNGQEHFWGVCQYCKEIAHFVQTSAEGTLYSWIERKEYAYGKLLTPLLGKKHILYITSGVAEENLVEFCQDFAIKHAQDVGFVLSCEYEEKSKTVSAVYRTVVLPKQLFPEKPSFIAEKIIIENVPGKLYSIEETVHEQFEKLTL